MDDCEKFIKGQKVVTCILTIVTWETCFQVAGRTPGIAGLFWNPCLKLSLGISLTFHSDTHLQYTPGWREALWKYLVFCPITQLNDPLRYRTWTFRLGVQCTDQLRPPNLPVYDLNYIQLVDSWQAFIFSFSSGIFGSLQTWWTGNCTF